MAMTSWNSGFGSISTTNASASLSGINLVSGAVADITSSIDKLKSLNVQPVDNSIAKLADAAGAAGKSFLQQKLDDLKNRWLSPTKISIESLLEEVAADAADPSIILKKLKKRATELRKSIVPALKELGAEAANYVVSDPATQQAFSQLSTVQSFAAGLEAVSTMIHIIKVILAVFEAVSKTVDIVSDFALTFWSGGTTAATATNKTGTLVEQIVQKTIAAVLLILKQTLFKIEIEVPAILVKSIDSLSVRESNQTVLEGVAQKSAFYRMLVEDELFDDTWNELKSNLAWSTAADAAIVKYLDNQLALNPVTDIINRGVMGIAPYATNVLDGTIRGDAIKSLLLKTTAQIYMEGVVSDARKAANISGYNYSDPSIYESYSQENITEKNIQDSIESVLAEDIRAEINWDEDTIRKVSKEILESM